MSKIKLQPQHLETISTWDISQVNIFKDHLKQGGRDRFRTILDLNTGGQNCKETAKSTKVCSIEKLFDEGLSCRKLRVRVSSIPQNRGLNELCVI